MKRIITSDDILGKEAVDSEGDVLGVVMKLHIDKESKEMTGISIDQGFMKPDLFVGMDYIKSFGVDVVFLNTIPADKLKGVEVMDSAGKKIGKVSHVVRHRNRIEKLVVKTSLLRNRTKDIFPHEIREIGRRIILK